MSAKVLCVGAAVLDTLYRVASLPKGDGKTVASDMLQIAEGMAASAACAVARLGGAASLWSAYGDDADGARIKSQLEAEGLDLSGARQVRGARSAQSTILIDEEGQRQITVFYDPSLHAEPRPVHRDEIAAFAAVLVDVRWPDLAEAVLIHAKALGIPAVLDGDVAPSAVLERLAAQASEIVFSEPAAQSLSGETAPEPVLRALARKLGHEAFCVTFGAEGSYWLEAGRLRHQPALKVTAVDTLAAGDAFHGGFALARAEGQSFADAIRLGTVTAALKCQVFGGRKGMPSRAEAEAALTQLTAAT